MFRFLAQSTEQIEKSQTLCDSGNERLLGMRCHCDKNSAFSHRTVNGLKKFNSQSVSDSGSERAFAGADDCDKCSAISHRTVNGFKKSSAVSQ